MKSCSKCKVTQPLDCFSKRSDARDGHQSWCKLCCARHRATKLAQPEYHARRNNEIREYHRSNVVSRLRNKMRGLIRRVAPGEKRFPSREILGYSVEELCHHLESQFEPGMSWQNRSAWHIDHIKPVTSFLSEGVTDPKIINALSNLRPLWAEANLSKGAK